MSVPALVHAPRPPCARRPAPREARKESGFNVTGLLAGLGVGGLAVALAAQKTVENLLGGVTLIADQPVRMGDFCRFGDRVGIVEDIGLRYGTRS